MGNVSKCAAGLPSGKFILKYAYYMYITCKMSKKYSNSFVQTKLILYTWKNLMLIKSLVYQFHNLIFWTQKCCDFQWGINCICCSLYMQDFMPVPSQEMDFKCHVIVFFVFNGLRWEVVICFVDTIDHRSLNFLFISCSLKWLQFYIWQWPNILTLHQIAAYQEGQI
jgi:hypothetical protein